MSQKTELRMARGITLVVGMFSVVFAISIESVLDILIYSYNFWAPIILVPLVCAVMGAAVSRTRFLAGAAAGIAGVLIWSTWLGKPWGIDGLVIGVFANLSVFFIFDRKNCSCVNSQKTALKG